MFTLTNESVLRDFYQTHPAIKEDFEDFIDLVERKNSLQEILQGFYYYTFTRADVTLTLWDGLALCAVFISVPDLSDQGEVVDKTVTVKAILYRHQTHDLSKI